LQQGEVLRGECHLALESLELAEAGVELCPGFGAVAVMGPDEPEVENAEEDDGADYDEAAFVGAELELVEEVLHSCHDALSLAVKSQR
jgi:hypothetical protein